MEPTESGTIDVTGQQIYYETYGKGQPLTLVMGIGYDSTLWGLHQIPDLAKNFRVIVFDNRDCGRSGQAGGDYSIGNMATDLKGVLDHLGLECTHLLGVSMGGMIAQEFAIQYPDMVDHLILVNTGAAPGRDATNPIREWAWVKARDTEGEIFPASQVAWLFSHEFRQNREAVDQIVAMLRGHPFPVTREGYARQARAYLEFDATKRLGSIDTPTLVIGGEQDRLTPAVELKQLSDSIPGARFHLFTGPGSSHISIVERAEEFNDQVRSFLTE